MIPSRRSFLKFLAAAAAVPTLPAIGQKVEPDLDSYGVWLGLETIIRPQWKFGQIEEISGRGYERLFIPGTAWKQTDRDSSIQITWPGRHTFFARGTWPPVDLITLFRKGKAIWRQNIDDGPYRCLAGDTISVHEIRIHSDWDARWTNEAAIIRFKSLLPGIVIR